MIGPFGVMGGHYQACGHAHLVNQIVSFGLNPQQALDTPRSFAYEKRLLVEASLDAKIIAALKAKGHKVEISKAPMGGGQCIFKRSNDAGYGILETASDSRKDGIALAY